MSTPIAVSSLARDGVRQYPLGQEAQRGGVARCVAEIAAHVGGLESVLGQRGMEPLEPLTRREELCRPRDEADRAMAE